MELRLDIAGYGDSDAGERAELAWEVEGVLRSLDLEEIWTPGKREPEGAKGAALEWSQLAVTLVGALPPLVTAVRGWLRRHPGASISLEVGGDRLTLTEPSSNEERELITAWLERHGG